MRHKMIALVLGILMTAAIFTGCVRAATKQNIDTSAGLAVQPVKSVQNIDRTQAMSVVKHMIHLDYSKYKIDLINDDLKYKGQQYFQFLISDENASIEPSIIVSKDNGEIYCYYPDKTTTEVYQDQVFKSKC